MRIIKITILLYIIIYISIVFSCQLVEIDPNWIGDSTNTRIISFDSQGGSTITSLTVFAGGLVKQPQNPIRTGYFFCGWFMESDCINPWNFNMNKVDNNITLYALWSTTSSFIVTFDSQGGSTIASQTVAAGGLATQPPNPTRAGYFFGGWFTETTCINPWNFAMNTVGNNITLYAKWSTTSFTVTFDSQGGSTIASQAVAAGGISTQPPNPTRAGYFFGGWFTETTCINPWNFNMITVNSDMTLYAMWSTTAFNVTFDSQGGSAITSQTVATDGLATQPPNPTRIGFTFSGWFSESACINSWNFNMNTVSSDITLYAKWSTSSSSFSVTFDSQGGSTIDSQTVAAGGLITPLPSNPTRSGFTFNGWFMESACINSWNFTMNTVNSNITLFAKWSTSPSFSVTFDTLGGSAIDSQTVAAGGLVTQPTTNPTRSGFIFNGWFTEATCINPWNFYMITVNSDTTLFAKWSTSPSFSVTFDTLGGSTIDSQTVAANGFATQPPTNPTRTGFIFNGWYREIACTNLWLFTSDVVTGTTTIYAKWKSMLFSGYYNNGSIDSPCYWDGTTRKELNIPAGLYGYSFSPTAQFNGTIYSVGYYFDGIKSIPCYWIGVNRHDLPGDGSHDAVAYSIIVSAGTIYTAGYYSDGTKKIPCYWIGTTRTDLPGFNSFDATAIAITIYGGTIYTAGCFNDGTKFVPCYWNGVNRNDLPGDGVHNAVASSISVSSGGTVYTAGYRTGSVMYTPCYWEGTTLRDLPRNGTMQSYATAIQVVDSTVYTAGYYYNGSMEVACYWINDIRYDLDVVNNSQAHSIMVYNGTVYTAGFYNDGSKDISCFWEGVTKYNLAGNGSYSAGVVSGTWEYIKIP